jgi:hypothetical protein
MSADRRSDVTRGRIDTLRSRPKGLPVIDMFARLCLALALAFVFTGRMEAAAAHCAKLASADLTAATPDPDAMPCHGADEAGAAETAGDHAAPHQTPADTCECVAVLKACSAIVAATGSARIEPYEWVPPESVAFVSMEPAPALRPPRA